MITLQRFPPLEPTKQTLKFPFPSSPLGNPTIYVQPLMGRKKIVDNPSFYVKAHFEEGNQQQRINEIEETFKNIVLNKKIKGKTTEKY